MEEVGKGQPRKFKTEKIFKNTFMKYIEYCEQKNKFPNVAGFCVFCHMHRSTFYEQAEYYSDTFKEVQEILEDESINSNNVSDTFRIFYMKNKFGYKDKQETLNVETSYEDYVKRVEGDEY